MESQDEEQGREYQEGAPGGPSMTEADLAGDSDPAGTQPGGGGGQTEEEGPDASELDKDPAYNPDDENLEGLKGG